MSITVGVKITSNNIRTTRLVHYVWFIEQFFLSKKVFNVQKDLQEEAEDTHSSMTHDPSSFHEQVWKYIWKISSV